MSARPLRLLVDTDIGTDADDAVCLAYLLHQPACRVEGITTVGRDAADRAAITDALCAHFGHPQIPIAAGAAHALYPTPYWQDHTVNQTSILERWPARRTYQAAQALDLMRRIVDAHPGEVVLLTLGPLTNAALLAAAAPDVAARLKAVVVMGGRFSYDPAKPRTECNVMLDPVAAGAVFAHPFPALRVVSLDTTGPIHLTPDAMERELAAPRLAPVRACARAWVGLKAGRTLGLHDPFTAATLFAPDLCRFERGRVHMRLFEHDLDRGTPLPAGTCTGTTAFTPDPDGPHALARGGDAPAFLTHLLATLHSRDAR